MYDPPRGEHPFNPHTPPPAWVQAQRELEDHLPLAGMQKRSSVYEPTPPCAVNSFEGEISMYTMWKNIHQGRRYGKALFVPYAGDGTVKECHILYL